MPHGDASEWAIDQFKEKAKASGGEITDDMLEDLKNQVTRSLGLSGDVLDMMAEEQDYI